MAQFRDGVKGFERAPRPQSEIQVEVRGRTPNNEAIGEEETKWPTENASG